MSINRTTANFNLRVPNYDEPQWHVPVDDNWDILDATLGLFVRVSNIRGPWKNATDYVVGDKVVDTATGVLYETQTAHTSASTGTFAATRTTYPDLWDRVDQFETDPSSPSFTIIETDDQVPSVNGSIVNAIDSTLFGPTNAGWVGKGLYTRRTNETQAQYEARIADPDNVAETTVYRYIGPEGFRVAQLRTTGFTLTQSNASQLIRINAATPQNVTFPVGVLRDDQKSHVSDIYPYMWGDLLVLSASEDVTIVPGSGVTLIWSNGQTGNVVPKNVVVRWVYLYTANGAATVYVHVGLGAADIVFDPATSGLLSTAVGAAILELKTGLDTLQTALDEAGLDGITASRTFPYPSPTSNVINLTTTELVSRVDSTTVYESIQGILNDVPSTPITVNLPVDVTAGDAFLLYHDDTQTAAVSIQNTGGVGTINGSSDPFVSNGPGSFIALFCKSNPGSAPVWRTGDVREVIQLLIRGYVESVVEVTATDTSALTFTYTSQNANIVEYTLEDSPASFTIAGVPATRVFTLTVKLIMDASGSHTWPHPTGCKFVNGTPPTIDDSANAETWLTYIVSPNGTYCFDGGTSWST